MKRIITYLLLTILITEIGILYGQNKNSHTKVLAETIEVTPTPTPEILPTPAPTPTPTPSNTPTPRPTETPLPIKITSSEINSLIDKYSGSYGVNPHLIRKIALCESGFNPSAQNGPYAGLFQFGTGAWTSLRRSLNLDTTANKRFDAEEAIKTATYAVSIGKSHLWPNCK